ncbi:helix-turn-helix transcriptional regulator [Candidatus Babeliales bacterium]|nr:helix-turn-helix transcriptional regulator [Candidatus Babeliales bacterium]MCF7899740.1 helix-turn-helix transcriptional regulator [Candidatus Babeliales bacterium]
MIKKIESTSDKFIKSLSTKEKTIFDEEYHSLLLSELLLALMEKDDLSVRKLAKLANVSPTVVQAMRSGAKKDFSMQSFFKILKGLGCTQLMAEFNGQFIPIDIAQLNKR